MYVALLTTQAHASSAHRAQLQHLQEPTGVAARRGKFKVEQLRHEAERSPLFLSILHSGPNSRHALSCSWRDHWGINVW